MLRDQWAVFEPGDIMLGDKGFCSYYDVWQLQQQGVDSVFTLARRPPVTPDPCVQVLGTNDLLIRWPKPRWNKRSSYSHDDWLAMPRTLTLRQVKVTVDNPGFRVDSFYLITTLTDATQYRRNELADLYYRRWAVELFFRDIKTTLGMDILRCRSPEGVTRELLIHLIAYNAIRSLMLEAADNAGTTPSQISFKVSLQALRQWEPQLSHASTKPAQYRSLRELLQTVIADAQLVHRPGRREPRCVKRRPKNFARMNRPRHLMQEIPHRNHYRAEMA